MVLSRCEILEFCAEGPLWGGKRTQGSGADGLGAGRPLIPLVTTAGLQCGSCQGAEKHCLLLVPRTDDHPLNVGSQVTQTKTKKGHVCRSSQTGGRYNMQVVSRRYSGHGAKELVDLVLKNKDEVTKLMRGVKGFVSYVVIKSGDEWMTATMCHDKAGCDESVRIARDWISKNGSSIGVGAPQISEGEVLLRIV
jgi:hypothetical protein